MREKKEKPLTPDELQREVRKLAMATLADVALTVDVPYLIERGDLKGQYGDAGGQAHYVAGYAMTMQNARNDPMLGGGLGDAHAQAVLRNIDAKGDRYAETVLGREVAEAAYKTIFGPSIAHATVGDLLNVMKYEGRVPKGLADRYIGDVLAKESKATEEEKRYVALILEEFQRRIADRMVGQSLLVKTALDNRGLEGKLNPEKPKKE